jgi:hypothetical protein
MARIFVMFSILFWLFAMVPGPAVGDRLFMAAFAGGCTVAAAWLWLHSRRAGKKELVIYWELHSGLATVANRWSDTREFVGDPTDILEYNPCEVVVVSVELSCPGALGAYRGFAGCIRFTDELIAIAVDDNHEYVGDFCRRVLGDAVDVSRQYDVTMQGVANRKLRKRR